MATNQREFIRVTVAIHVELRMGGNAVIPGELVNVSLNGVLLRGQAIVPDGTPCIAVIHLDGGAGGPTIEARGHVVRTEADQLAVQFTDIMGTDGMRHLRNLVLYNSGTQADHVEAEFQSHLGLKPIS